jgi:hypothetical protein
VLTPDFLSKAFI